MSQNVTKEKLIFFDVKMGSLDYAFCDQPQKKVCTKVFYSKVT